MLLPMRVRDTYFEEESRAAGPGISARNALGKTKKRGKHAWFIEDEYVLDNNAINVEKSVRNNKPWARAALQPLRQNRWG